LLATAVVFTVLSHQHYVALEGSTPLADPQGVEEEGARQQLLAFSCGAAGLAALVAAAAMFWWAPAQTSAP
jgi:hypothetical protein